jgi:hypothetical protein
MDVPTTLVLLFIDGKQKTFAHTTVAELAHTLWKEHPGAVEHRKFLAILRPEMDTHFLYDPYYFGLLKIQDKTFDQIHEQLWCNGLYRNKVDLKGKFDSEIEAGSLWLLRDDTLYLVNDDWNVQASVNNSFTKIA